MIRELTPALVDDYLAFFDRDAFADNPEWQGCYCRFFQHGLPTREAWWAESNEKNRAAVAARIRRGDMTGLLYYDGGKVVGWCQATRPYRLTSLGMILGVSPGEETGVITCFVVAKPARGKGVARALLGEALAMFRRDRLTVAEAYPHKRAKNDAEGFPGPLSLYREAGFEEVRDLPPDRVVVRRAL